MDEVTNAPVGTSASDEVGWAMRLARRRYRVSQRELAALLGLHPAVVARWERGRCPVGLERVSSVLHALGFAFTVVPIGPREWDEVVEPAQHIADLSLRRFPAHLDEHLGRDPSDDLARYGRWPANPWSPDWTYRMDPERRAVMRARLREERPRAASRAAEGLWTHPPGGTGTEGGSGADHGVDPKDEGPAA